MKLRVKFGLAIAALTLFYSIVAAATVFSLRQDTIKEDLQRVEQHLIDEGAHERSMGAHNEPLFEDPVHGTFRCHQAGYFDASPRASRLSPGEFVMVRSHDAQLVYRPRRHELWGARCARFGVEQTRDRVRLAQRFKRHIAMRVLAGLFIVLSSWLLLVYPLVRRLVGMSHRARAIIERGFEGELDDGARDEIGDLARTFDFATQTARRELEREEERTAQLRETLAELSHDMRTPLSTLKLSVARLERGEPSADVLPVWRSNLAHLDEMFSNFSLLVQLQDTTLPLHTSEVDLDELATRLVARFAPLARDQGVTMHASVEESARWIEADSVAIEQAIGNVLHNAIKFARAHVALTAFPSSDGAHLLIDVLDDGDAPLAEVLTLSEASPRHLKLNGWGLGIAHHIASRHGGRFELTRPHAGETRARFELPLTKAPHDR